MRVALALLAGRAGSSRSRVPRAGGAERARRRCRGEGELIAPGRASLPCTVRTFAVALCLGLMATGAAAAIELEDCQVSGPGGFGRLAARCGTLEVPLNPAEPEGQKIGLFVAVVPALSKVPEPDAFTVIAGGPGQASTEFYVGVAGSFERIRRERDIVLVDQRGTGQSNALECSSEPAGLDTSSPERVREETERCLEQLPSDPRYYTTSVAVRDLELVRAALGYDSWNLYGISYGTRVALHYLRRYPETTRSVVLDGVVPADTVLGPHIAPDAQAALDAIFARCAADPGCSVRFPELPSAFRELLEELRERPVPLNVSDPLDDSPIELLFGVEQLGLAVRLLSYASETASLLPILIWEGRAGKLERLALQALLVARSLDESMSGGMHNSIVCTEDAPFYNGRTVDREALERSYLGALTYELLIELCALWPRGVIDAGFKEPVVSERPVLLLSGENDPITPPASAEQAAATLSNSLHIVGPGQGHGMAPRGCLSRLIAEFVEAGSPTGLDPSCADVLRATPFFVRRTGPEP